MAATPPPRREPEVIDVDRVAGPDSAVRVERLSPTQRAALWLTVGVGLVIAAVTVVVLFDWIWLSRTSPPVLPEGAVDTSVANRIQDYKTLAEAHQDRVTRLFDLVVVKALLPVFATLAGYVLALGREADRAHEPISQ